MCRASSFLLYRRVSSAWGRTLPFLSNGNRSPYGSVRHPPIRHIRSSSLSWDSQRGVKTDVDSSEFKKWHNGGGWIHSSAKVEPTVVVEIGAVVHSGSVLGANVHLGSGAIVGPDVGIGQATKIGYNASLCNCSIGDHCIIHNGVSVGQDGFGFDVVEGRMLKKPQLLHARIGNHVEIGANSCIDRGSWRDTIIGDHSKIDNLVQVRLAANSCVTKSINEPGDYGGFPAVPIREWRKQIAKIRQITKMPQSPK
ncbi:probable UDP-3-O-acylglucosamine N-acyltransferase 2, mitochondrial isoform X2 [Nymphaea colorata]|uniref:probable UDP-3-O-acylglucosamine N-acyltransferase 2, mitochondrial isoform X2 n=1 Tax=Nymphaea colorata TaxID=210225 RepID=UPI00129EC9F3|nr:probable UDP-3-O-acylglucosamine N-acyltransferase 2, mitochondrial isoform X2 [Nymphaea colorata]